MKIIFLILCALLIIMASGSWAQTINAEKAGTIATNWLTLVLNKQGDWGGRVDPSIARIEEYKRGDRTIGYYCKVEPRGYIIVSLLEGLAPIACFSTTSNLDPQLDEGPGDMTKHVMERLLDGIEKELGPLSGVRLEKLRPLLEVDHSNSWARLSTEPGRFQADLVSGLIAWDYQQSMLLLKSYWHQNGPYNNDCPPASNGCTSARCTVGCLATAAAQIMRYWSWPDGRDYYNMKDTVWTTCLPEEQAAVAELCHALGMAVDMHYCSSGCTSTQALTEMENVFEGWGYDSDCAIAYRIDHTWNEWWDLIKFDIDHNMPIEYGITAHAIVCDGYWEVGGDYLYHMNYGNWDGNDGWYSLDQLAYPYGGGVEEDKMLFRIKPFASLGSFAFGNLFGYSYVDRDCDGSSLTFMPGSQVRFLSWPQPVLSCSAGYIRFQGTPTQNTIACSIDSNRGIKCINSSLMMYPGAQMQFRIDRRDVD